MIKRLKIGLVCALALAVTSFAITSCGKETKTEKASEDLSGKVLVVGSSALQPLAQHCAKEFMSKNPGVTVNVQGGGSGMGLSQISQGSVQVGNSDIFAEEKGIDIKNLVDNKVAVVGMGPVVNKDVKVDNLTQDQLIGIFTGKITNWKQVGGQDLPIVIINRAEGSGTRATFEQFGLNKAKSVSAQEQDNSGAVQKIVKETPGAISYLAFSYFNDDIKALKIDGIAPTRENVEKNKWKIWSYEHMYTKKDADKGTTAYVKYVMSKEVQDKIVPKLGYIPIVGMKVERNVNGEVVPIK